MKKLLFAITSILVVLGGLLGIGKVAENFNTVNTQNQYEQQQELATTGIEEETSDSYSLAATVTYSWDRYNTTTGQYVVKISGSYPYITKNSGTCYHQTVTARVQRYSKGSTPSLTTGSTVNYWTWRWGYDAQTDTNTVSNGNTDSFTKYLTLSNYNATTYDYYFQIIALGDLSAGGSATCPNGSQAIQYQSGKILPPTTLPTVTNQSYSVTPATAPGQADGSFTYNLNTSNPSSVGYGVNVTIAGTGTNTYTDTRTFSRTTQTYTWTGLLPGTYNITLTDLGYTTINGLNTTSFQVTIPAQAYGPVSTTTAMVTSNAPSGNTGVMNLTTTTTIPTPATGTSPTVAISSVQYSKDGGTTWQTGTTTGTGSTRTTTYTYSSLPSNFYTIKTRVNYTYDADGTGAGAPVTKIYSAPDITVGIATTAIYSPPQLAMTYTETPTTGGSSNGAINATYTCTGFCYGNIQAVEIQTNNSGNWTNINTGITGLAAGTYQVSYRTKYNNGTGTIVTSAASANQSVTVTSSGVIAPTWTFTTNSTPTSNPNATDGSITATATKTNGTSVNDEVYWKISQTSTAGSTSWVGTSGTTTATSSTYTALTLAAGTYYVDAYVMYDSNSDGTKETRIDLTEQQISVNYSSWTQPDVTAGAVTATSNSVSYEVNFNNNTTTNAANALVDVTVQLTTTAGTVLQEDILTATDFAGTNLYSGTFTSVASGNYYVKMSYRYDLKNGSGIVSSGVVQIPITVAAANAPVVTWSATAPTITPHTTEGTGNGSYTKTNAFTISNATTVGTTAQLKVYKFDSTTGLWNTHSTQTINLTGTDTKTGDISITGLTHGSYRFDLTYTVSGQPLTWSGQTSFNIDKSYTSTLNATAAQQGYYLSDYRYNSTTGVESYDITYYLTPSNNDYQGYYYDVTLTNDTTGQSVTQNLNATTQEVVFQDVPFGQYTLTVSDNVANTSGAVISGVTASYSIDLASTINPINIDGDSGTTAQAYTDTFGNTYGVITSTYIINNPDNLAYSYDLVVYNNTLNQEVSRTTFTNSADGCDINTVQATGMLIDSTNAYQYTVYADNVTGALVGVSGLPTQQNPLVYDYNDFTTAMATPTTNGMTPAKVTGITIGTILLAGLLTTSTYILIRRKRGNK